MKKIIVFLFVDGKKSNPMQMCEKTFLELYSRPCVVGFSVLEGI